NEFEVEKTAKKFVKAIQDLSEATATFRDPQGPLFSALENLNRATRNLENIIKEIDSGKGIVGALVRSEELTQGVRQNLDKVQEIVENIRLTAGKAPSTMDQVQLNLAGIESLRKGLSESVESVESVLKSMDERMNQLAGILNNLETGSRDVPEITQTAKEGISEIREGMDKIDRVFQSLQENFLIRQNLPATPSGTGIDAGLRR
ncbi:MAG: hypothetical protein AB1659_10565, partial [Thermodesulfobacteriota bacterium]